MFRTKLPTPELTASAAQQLSAKIGLITKQFINLQANALPFSSSDSLFLYQQLRRDAQRFRPLTSSLPAISTKHYFCNKNFAIDTMKGSVAPNAVEFAIPLPKHFIDPADEGVVQPRTFYHTSDVDTIQPIEEVLSPRGLGLACKPVDRPLYPWPRCGQTGLFFKKEEVVDNLIQAAIHFGYQSPFWIPSTHPQVGKFLLLKPDSNPIAISLTMRLAPIDVVKQLPHHLVIPQVHSAVAAAVISKEKSKSFFNNVKGVGTGANVFTGKALHNTYVTGAPGSEAASSGFRASLSSWGVEANAKGLWISLDQFLRHGLELKSEIFSMPTGAPNDELIGAYIAKLLEVFPLVEERSMVLYSGDQLVQPGRLSLKKSLDDGSAPDLEKVFV